MAAHGISHALIGDAVGIDKKTLEKHFRSELDRARPQFMAKCAKAMAMHLEGRPAEYDAKGNVVRKEVEPSTTMAIFAAKTVLGLKETVNIGMDVTRLNESETDGLIWLVRKATETNTGTASSVAGESGRTQTPPANT